MPEPSIRSSSGSVALPPPATCLSLLGILLLSFGGSLLLCTRKLFWVDELFEYFSDSRPSFAAIITGQRYFPFSLEPPAFHLLLHVFQKLPLRPEIATRLPSIFALLLTEVCLFLLLFSLTRRSAPALLAAALPFALATFDYSAEARVYSLLTAVYAVAFCSYRAALSSSPRRRLVGAVCLFASLGSAVLLHYFGLLLPLPFLFAELVRLLRNRRVQLSAVVPTLLSLSLFLLNLPFLAGLRDVKAMYYDSGEARWNMIPFTYLWVFLRSRIYPLRARPYLQTHIIDAAILLLLLAGIFVLWRRYRKATLPFPASSPSFFLLLALIAGLLVPACNVTIAVLRTHAYTPRYSLPVAVPLVALLALLLAPFLRRQVAGGSALAVVLLAGLVECVHFIHQAHLEAVVFLHDLQPGSTLTAALQTTGDPHIYIQDMPAFLTTYWYASPDIKPRLLNLQSVPMEWYWHHNGPSSLFSVYMARSSTVPVTTYERVATEPGPHLLILFDKGSEWITEELAARHATVTPLGPALGGNLFRFSLPSTNPYPYPSSTPR